MGEGHDQQLEQSVRLPAGTRLAHYEIVAFLAEGAMGEVYVARDLGLDRDVALKVLRPDVAEDERVIKRFTREARAAARVNHPNLTHIYFVGSHETVRFFVMELIPGQNLAEQVREHGPLDLESAVDVLVQIAEGMAAAHAAGVVHRDLKPGNVLRRPDGFVKITDFGLARSFDADGDLATPGMLLGTPYYMSPEQSRGGPVDTRSDVYTLGILAFHLLTGRPPFLGPSMSDVLHDHQHKPLPRLGELRAGLTEALEEAVSWCCEKDPDRRPQSMQVVAELFESLRPREVDRAAITARAAAAGIDAGLVVLVASAIAWPLVRLGVVLDPWRHGIAAVGLLHVGLVGIPEWRWRQSPGKWLFELAATRADGVRMSPRTAMWRYLLRYAPLLLCSLMVLLAPIVSFWCLALLQPTLLGAGVVAYALTDDQTLSDVFTGTGVIYLLPLEHRRRARRHRYRRLDPLSPADLDANAATRVIDPAEPVE